MTESRLVLGALLVVPLGSVLYFTLQSSSGTERPPVPSSAPVPLGDEEYGRGIESRSEVIPRPSGASQDEFVVEPNSRQPGAQERSRQDSDDVEDRGDEEEDAQGKLERFDENAGVFDARLAQFDREVKSGRVDLTRGARVAEAVREEVLDLLPEARIKVICTPSVCEVEVASEEPVGVLLARLSPWLVEVRDFAATGNPRREEEGREAFRLLFDATTAPGRVDE